MYNDRAEFLERMRGSDEAVLREMRHMRHAIVVDWVSDAMSALEFGGLMDHLLSTGAIAPRSARQLEVQFQALQVHLHAYAAADNPSDRDYALVHSGEAATNLATMLVAVFLVPVGSRSDLAALRQTMALFGQALINLQRENEGLFEGADVTAEVRSRAAATIDMLATAIPRLAALRLTLSTALAPFAFWSAADALETVDQAMVSEYGSILMLRRKAWELENRIVFYEQRIAAREGLQR